MCAGEGLPGPTAGPMARLGDAGQTRRRAEDGLNLGTRGQVSEMSVLRLYALLTIGFTVGLAIMTAFMNTPPRNR